jgi:hypothetical protein
MPGTGDHARIWHGAALALAGWYLMVPPGAALHPSATEIEWFSTRAVPTVGSSSSPEAALVKWRVLTQGASNQGPAWSPDGQGCTPCSGSHQQSEQLLITRGGFFEGSRLRHYRVRFVYHRNLM